jgi:hypothetical protein
MATPAAVSTGTSVQRALNEPLPQLDRRPRGRAGVLPPGDLTTESQTKAGYDT